MLEIKEALCKGALGWVFWISRLFGVAPFTFTQGGPVISHFLTLYGFFFVTLLNAIVLAGLVLDLGIEPSRSYGISTSTSSLVWIANCAILMLIASISVYQGPSRTASNINLIRQIIKIKVFMGIKKKIVNSSDTTNQQVTVVLIMGLLCLLLLLDLYYNLIQGLYFGKDIRILVMYSFLYSEYFLILLVKLQFTLIALQIQSILQTINEDLKKQEYSCRNDDDRKLNFYSIKSNKKVTNKINNYVFQHGKNRMSNCTVDFVGAFSKRSLSGPKIAMDTFINNYKNIRSLAIVYGRACAMIRQLDQGHGLLLMFILLSYLVQLVITLYYTIESLHSLWNWRASVMLHFIWCIYHFCDIILVVEPCHRTQEEIKRTQELVCMLFSTTTSPNELLHAELELFCKLLKLNQPSYSPLRMCTISRLLTLTIIGAVTTYLVIIFQFRNFAYNGES